VRSIRAQCLLVIVDLRAASSLQNVGGAAVAAAMMLLTGTRQWDGSVQLWSALAWSVVVASLMGLTLLLWMLRRGDATKVTALMLLVPPLAALGVRLVRRNARADSNRGRFK